MDSMLLMNNVSSAAGAIACWWLAHTYSAVGFPYGRVIATLWAILGMSLMLTAFARNLYVDPNPFFVVSKVVLTILCLTIARRVTANAKVMSKLMPRRGEPES